MRAELTVAFKMWSREYTEQHKTDIYTLKIKGPADETVYFVSGFFGVSIGFKVVSNSFSQVFFCMDFEKVRTIYGVDRSIVITFCIQTLHLLRLNYLI